MKKIYFISAASLLFTLSSCVKDGSFEQNIPILAPAMSIITNLDNNEVTVAEGLYVFQLKVTESSHSASVVSPQKDFIVNNTDIAFSTDPQPFTTSGYDYIVKDASATVGNTNWELKNANFIAANPLDKNVKYGFYFNTEQIGEYTFKFDYGYMTIARYFIGDSYRVNTFPYDSFFNGTTITTYSFAGATKEFENDEITYRFNIYKDPETKEYKAFMILYNARFAEEMPMSLTAVLVEDLDVEFTSSSVKITGHDIIPKWFTAGKFEDLERYEFKDVNFETTDNSYTMAKLTYQVGKDYFGKFEGAYANLSFNP